MHYVQTRIATIDTYAVFFIILMYDAMLVFIQHDLKTDSFKKLLPPLLLSGIFMGLGIASKWTVALWRSRPRRAVLRQAHRLLPRRERPRRRAESAP